MQFIPSVNQGHDKVHTSIATCIAVVMKDISFVYVVYRIRILDSNKQDEYCNDRCIVPHAGHRAEARTRSMFRGYVLFLRSMDQSRPVEITMQSIVRQSMMYERRRTHV
jgi:hypothetical protein